MSADRCANCRGHLRYIGGRRDGEVTHLTIAHPSDYPLSMGTILRDGQRSWYLREGPPVGDATYRCVGVSKETPEVVRRAHEQQRRG